jgi:hypothetical protein
MNINKKQSQRILYRILCDMKPYSPNSPYLSVNDNSMKNTQSIEQQGTRLNIQKHRLTRSTQHTSKDLLNESFVNIVDSQDEKAKIKKEKETIIQEFNTEIEALKKKISEIKVNDDGTITANDKQFLQSTINDTYEDLNDRVKRVFGNSQFYVDLGIKNQYKIRELLKELVNIDAEIKLLQKKLDISIIRNGDNVALHKQSYEIYVIISILTVLTMYYSYRAFS